jgi:YceI-like domain
MAAPLTGAFVIEPRRSTVLIRATSSVHPIEIRSRAPEGELTLTEDGGSGSLVVPVRTLRSGTPLQDIELRRQIQARRFKTIEATLRTLRREGDGDDFAADGDITFFGTTQPARGRLRITGDAELRIVGEATFDVTAFGFTPPNILGVRVHDEIAVHVDLVAIRR